MHTITKHIILITFIICQTSSQSYAQYSTIELSTFSSSFIDDNVDARFQFRLGSIPKLTNYHLGYSFPLNVNILFTTKIGVAKAREQYFNEIPFVNYSNDFSINTDKKVTYGIISIASTYWLHNNYIGPFFSGELSVANMLSATSISREVTVFDEPLLGALHQNITADFRNEIQKIMPTVKIGLGYNLDLLTRLNFFIKFNIEYRPSGYYKNTKNISHLSRHTDLGIKYVFGANTSFIKRFKKNYDEKFNN